MFKMFKIIKIIKIIKMIGILILGLIIVCLILAIYTFANNENHCFRAAVYEHIRQGDQISTRNAIDINLKVYENVAQIAASQVI